MALWSPRSAIVAPAANLPSAMYSLSISWVKKKSGSFQSQSLKARAQATQTSVQIIASLNFTSCALRWNTPRSNASIRRTNALNPIHNQPESIIAPPEEYTWGAKRFSFKSELRDWQD